MSFGGVYVGRKFALIFSVELLWLATSATVLVVANGIALNSPPTVVTAFLQASCIVAIYLATFYLMDLYHPDVMGSIRACLPNLTQAIGLFLIIVWIFATLSTTLSFYPKLLLAHTLLTVVFVLLARTSIERASHPAVLTSHYGVVTSDVLRNTLQLTRSQCEELGFDLVWLGNSLKDVDKMLVRSRPRAGSPRTILIDGELLDSDSAAEFFELCRERAIRLHDVRVFTERMFGKALLDSGLIRCCVSSQITSGTMLASTTRRTRDLVLSGVMLMLTLPLTLATMIAIKLDSPGPTIFRQRRIGEHGRPFTMLKLRSMRHHGGAGEAGQWATREDDPRLTRVGRLIRRFHLDELPQLINVIRGEMSLVGPRPFHPLQVAELSLTLPHFGLRHLVKPGITGWAQVRCAYAASVEDRAEVFARDLYYVKYQSLLFDLQILLETVRVCLWRRGSR